MSKRFNEMDESERQLRTSPGGGMDPWRRKEHPLEVKWTPEDERNTPGTK
ncbi:hypothetical protein RhiirA4_485889 [Rhizophagus irregularis]|uniref:Uncharacterized protein n=1 Tax=Rhizophagus irregularis TaxID=588596 RepID=A0A2I1HQS5_9GLOM|nr:hypothetical protein RhiirA4_485889 [Rhizophagus irregularis]